MAVSALLVMTRSKNRVGSVYVIQIAENFEEDTHKMKWRTITEVAKILLDTATVTQAERTAAVEAARAICCLARSGSICFDLDANLIKIPAETKQRRETK